MTFEWYELVLLFVGAFGFGYGLAERSNRKSISELDSAVSRLFEKLKS